MSGKEPSRVKILEVNKQKTDIIEDMKCWKWMFEPKARKPRIMTLNEQVGLREDVMGNGEWVIWKKRWTQLNFTGAKFPHQSRLCVKKYVQGKCIRQLIISMHSVKRTRMLLDNTLAGCFVFLLLLILALSRHQLPFLSSYQPFLSDKSLENIIFIQLGLFVT